MAESDGWVNTFIKAE
jgi:hypothetical protein